MSRSPSPDPARKGGVEDAEDPILPPGGDPAVISHRGAPAILPGGAPAIPHGGAMAVSLGGALAVPPGGALAVPPGGALAVPPGGALPVIPPAPALPLLYQQRQLIIAK
uniref:Uncharacterized protein n=1 Tax=Amphimedon queenslandica TaxID=400682 RepID=A0A1X7V3I3_AMPQE